jgi:hypothetical protein
LRTERHALKGSREEHASLVRRPSRQNSDEAISLSLRPYAYLSVKKGHSAHG